MALFLFAVFLSPAFAIEKEVSTYFKKVALGSEFGSETNRKTHKWIVPIRVFVRGEKSPILINEINSLIKELNGLIVSPRISITQKKHEANFFVYFGKGEYYGRYINPSARKYISSNWGTFHVNYDDSGNIVKADMYVDTHRTRNDNQRKHLLREEFTQALGLMNDTDDYIDSMFYQSWTEVTSFSQLDKQLIRLLYHPSIQSGMTGEDLDLILPNLRLDESD